MLMGGPVSFAEWLAWSPWATDNDGSSTAVLAYACNGILHLRTVLLAPCKRHDDVDIDRFDVDIAYSATIGTSINALQHVQCFLWYHKVRTSSFGLIWKPLTADRHSFWRELGRSLWSMAARSLSYPSRNLSKVIRSTVLVCLYRQSLGHLRSRRSKSLSPF